MLFGEEHAPPPYPQAFKLQPAPKFPSAQGFIFSAAEQEKVGTADRATQWQETGPGQHSSAACEANQHGVFQEFGGGRRCDEPDRWVSEL